MTPTIAVIMPAYNEADRIAQTIATVARYAVRNQRIGPVILADDGSDDSTIEIAMQAAAKAGLSIEVFPYRHEGKALTVRSAMLEAADRVSAEYLMMLDADDEIPIDQLDRVNWSGDPRTIYIARRVGQVEGARRDSPSSIRSIMSKGMRIAAHLLLGLRYADTQCGFKLFPRTIVQPLFEQQRSTGWTFDAELLFIADRISHLPIREIPVVWVPRGVSNVRPSAAMTGGVAMLSTALRRARRVYRPVGMYVGIDLDGRAAVAEKHGA